MRRRDLLACGPALLATRAHAQAAPVPAIADYERSSGGRVGVFAENTRTGRRFAWRAGERFVMCSTFKASLAALVLARVDRGRDDLEGLVRYGPGDMQNWYAPAARENLGRGAMSVREMCEAACEQSDNTCANLLLTRVGGPAAVTRYWRSLGDRTSRLDDPEPLLNRTPPGGVRDTTTPAAMAATLRTLVLGSALAAPSRRLLTGWLLGCKTGGDRLRSGLPAGWTTGDKTGNNGQDAAGDLAITWPTPAAPIVVCAYTRGGSPTAGQLADVFKGVARHAAATLA